MNLSFESYVCQVVAAGTKPNKKVNEELYGTTHCYM